MKPSAQWDFSALGIVGGHLGFETARIYGWQKC